MPLELQRGGESVFFPGKAAGGIGCLVVHGITASPQEIYWLAEHLAKGGHTVFAPRHPGHATHPRDIKRMRWQDWYYGVLDGYHMLRRLCDQVVVVGFSMGGLLALHLAAEQALARLVVIAAPLVLDSPTWLPFLARPFGLTLLTFDREADPMHHRILAMQRERGEPTTGRVAYYQHSAAGIVQLLRLGQAVSPLLGSIRSPTLLIYSEKDDAVPFRNMALLQSKLTASAGVETLTLHESKHIITSDIEYEQVYSAVAQFVGKASQP
ncbi:MAG TPA: alpha/beta fold hydrolase [Aggregatilineales bacterium]|nr:alpha/beta fold hydrolase [Anaerolineales bacterium]HRE46189.1 alpha/beta fold hydrolase [Aggregatilineales bacterium]